MVFLFVPIAGAAISGFYLLDRFGKEPGNSGRISSDNKRWSIFDECAVGGGRSLAFATAPEVRSNGEPRQRLKPVLAPAQAVAARAVTAARRRLSDARTRALELLQNDAYAQAVKEISLESKELSQEELAANQFVKLSSVLMGTSVVSAIVYPPLLFLQVPVLLYVAAPMYKEGYHDLVKQRKITTTVVDVALSVGCLAYLPFHPSIIVVSAIGSWAYSLTNKMVVHSKDNTRKRLTNLFGEQPKKIWIEKDGVEYEVPFESVIRGDTVVLNAGETAPVDGVVMSGAASIDQRMLTGESQPAEKAPGDTVYAATTVLTGRVRLRVEKTGEETAAAEIGAILQRTSDFTSSVQLRGKEISDNFATPTLGLAGIAAVAVGPVGGLAVLLSGVGYSMRMLGPLAVLNFLRLAAQRGILIKDGRVLEQIGAIDTVVFDKTGTLTLEQPYLAELHAVGQFNTDEVLTHAAAAEYRQTHPIAKAILQAAHEKGLEVPAVDDAAYEVGYGIKVLIDGRIVRVGSERYMTMCSIPLPPESEQITEKAHENGASLVYVTIDEKPAGILELHPAIRPEAKRIVSNLKQRGLRLYIISGDHQRPTAALANQLGIEHFFANTLPLQKAEHIDRLQAEGRRVCFIGDGINDAIALKKARVSVSLKGASTAATDCAQAILMDQTLNQLEELFVLSEEFEKNMQKSLITSIVPGAVTVAGAFVGMVGFTGAMGLSVLGGAAGVANAMTPLLSSPTNGRVLEPGKLKAGGDPNPAARISQAHVASRS